jgi:dTDP-4-amino-4,6-dideoxygalactose transaminase
MSRALWENEISLPIFYSMTDEMVLEVVNAVVSSYNDVISIANSSNIS